jgi:hypothetical protein
VILAGVRTNRTENVWPYMSGIAKQNGTIPECLAGSQTISISVSRSFKETVHPIEQQLEQHRYEPSRRVPSLVD